MRRRKFITLLGSTLSWPLAARAQSGARALRRGIGPVIRRDEISC